MECSQVYKGQLRRKGDPDITCGKQLNEDGRHKGAHHALVEKPPVKGDPTSKFMALQQDQPASILIARWSDSGAHFSPLGTKQLMTCDTCDTFFVPKTHIGETGDETSCFYCRLWLRRAEDYAKPETHLIRPHDQSLFTYDRGLFSWSPRSAGFGKHPYYVEWDDGRTGKSEDGHRGGLWSAGNIPWEMDHLFPPNGVIRDLAITNSRGEPHLPPT